MKRQYLLPGIMAGAALFVAYGCDQPDPHSLNGDPGTITDCPPTTGSGENSTGTTDPSTTNSTGSSTGSGGPGTTELDARVVDYGEALRTASLKLVGNLPTVEEVYELHDLPEGDRAAKFESMVDAMMDDPRFTMRMIEFYRNVFNMEGPGVQAGHPSRETAPAFAARIMVEGRPWTDMLVASSDTCPTYDMATNTFTPGECGNNTIPSGVLTDPGIHSLYYGNLAFRRNRFFHEVFLCRNGNAEGGAEPTTEPSNIGPCGAQDAPANYNSPWPMNSIAGECNDGPVNFHEYNTTTICANCHTTWNHRAPLFGKFDANGMFVDGDDYQVLVPVEGSPNAVLSDWLPPGEPFAWKFNVPVTDLPDMGQKMAQDDEVLACAVKRTWNYAMSRGDIVDNETPVPNKVIADLVESFKGNNYNMRAMLRSIVTSEDFVRF